MSNVFRFGEFKATFCVKQFTSEKDAENKSKGRELYDAKDERIN